MIEIIVHGSPAPQGSKRFVGTSKSGRGIMIESSARVKPWRQDVLAAAVRAMDRMARLDGPLFATMTFTLPKPASAPKTRRTWPCRKPDLSKLVRSTEDALSDAGVWADDARVVSMLAHKVFPGEGDDSLASPGAVIRVYGAEEARCVLAAGEPFGVAA